MKAMTIKSNLMLIRLKRT